MLGRPRRSECLAIDTNLLLLLLGYRCLLAEKSRPQQRFQVLSEIRGRGDNISPERFDDLWNLFLNARRRIVTHYIIAETYGSRKRLESFKNRKDLVWKSALALLADPGIEELSCKIQDLSVGGYRDILTDIGPGDAGLIFTAEQLKATIITDDGQLAHWAGVRSVPAVRLEEMGNF